MPRISLWRRPGVPSSTASAPDPHRLIAPLEREIARFVGRDRYIPEPRPVRSDVEITAIYYPGTDQMAEWDMIGQTMPQTKPLLGWYDEGNPENIDWQIKWSVEHGITSFLVDWYWCKECAPKGDERLRLMWGAG